jgi:hypothetical protein
MDPDAAYNGTDFLAAWLDRRHGPSQIYCTQVTAGGAVLSDTGVRLSGRDSSFEYSLPAVASNGDQYLTAWLGTRPQGSVVLGTRLAAGGEVLDPLPLAFSCDTVFQQRLGVESDGRDYLVVWTSPTASDTGSDLWCRRLSNAGELLDSAPKLVASSPFGITEPALAFGGNCYLAVWSGMADESQVFGCRIRPDGTVLDPNGFPICTGPGRNFDPAVASDGERFLVTWTENQSEDCDIYATLVDTGGVTGLEMPGVRTGQGRLRLAVSPRPSRSQVAIRFTLPQTQDVRLDIYDAVGRHVRRLASGLLPAGTSELCWDGGAASPGNYFCRLSSDLGSITARITLLATGEP